MSSLRKRQNRSYEEKKFFFVINRKVEVPPSGVDRIGIESLGSPCHLLLLLRKINV